MVGNLHDPRDKNDRMDSRHQAVSQQPRLPVIRHDRELVAAGGHVQGEACGVVVG
jgi:hypothetical protein